MTPWRWEPGSNKSHYVQLDAASYSVRPTTDRIPESVMKYYGVHSKEELNNELDKFEVERRRKQLTLRLHQNAQTRRQTLQTLPMIQMSAVNSEIASKRLYLSLQRRDQSLWSLPYGQI